MENCWFIKDSTGAVTLVYVLVIILKSSAHAYSLGFKENEEGQAELSED